MTARDDQRGVALLMVLMLLATVAVVAVATTALVGRSVARAQAAQARDAGVWALRGAEVAAVALLDAATSAAPPPIGRTLTLPVGGGAVQARLDPVACLNVNAFVSGGPGAYATPTGSGGAAGPGIAAFGRLVVALGGNEPAARRLAEATADFLDTDETPNPGGAEDFDLVRRAVPYRTANRLIADPSELRAVPGWDAATYGALRPYLCALPGTAVLPLDVNGLRPGDAPVLAAHMRTTLPIGEIERLIAGRPEGGWESAADFTGLPLVAGSGLDPTTVDVTPGLLSLSARATSGGQELGMIALIYRDGGAWRVISRRFGPVPPAPPASQGPASQGSAR